jgi:RNA polymerase sigma-70 factor (sigma-E family)
MTIGPPTESSRSRSSPAPPGPPPPLAGWPDADPPDGFTPVPDDAAADPEDALVVGAGSFEVVYAQTYPAMVRLAVLMMGDNQAAEELVQDVFITVYRRWHRLRTPHAYIRQSVMNACRDALRRRQVKERLHLRRPSTPPIDGTPEHVDDLLATLNPRQRAVVVLRFYEDLSIDDIAELLGTRPGTVKSLLHRSLGSLRKDLR